MHQVPHLWVCYSFILRRNHFNNMFHSICITPGGTSSHWKKWAALNIFENIITNTRGRSITKIQLTLTEYILKGILNELRLYYPNDSFWYPDQKAVTKSEPKNTLCVLWSTKVTTLYDGAMSECRKSQATLVLSWISTMAQNIFDIMSQQSACNYFCHSVAKFWDRPSQKSKLHLN